MIGERAKKELVERYQYLYEQAKIKKDRCSSIYLKLNKFDRLVPCYQKG